MLLTKLSSKALDKDELGIEEAAHQALAIADAEGNYLMKAAIHLQLALAYIQIGKLNHALKQFRNATCQASLAKTLDEQSAADLEIKSLCGEGAVSSLLGNLEDGDSVHEEAAKIACCRDLVVSLMEGVLIAAYCFEKFERYIDAYRYSDQALLMAELHDMNVQAPRGLLVRIGKRLLRLSQILERSHHGNPVAEKMWAPQKIHKRLTALVGEDWQKFLDVDTFKESNIDSE